MATNPDTPQASLDSLTRLPSRARLADAMWERRALEARLHFLGKRRRRALGHPAIADDQLGRAAHGLGARRRLRPTDALRVGKRRDVELHRHCLGCDVVHDLVELVALLLGPRGEPGDTPGAEDHDRLTQTQVVGALMWDLHLVRVRIRAKVRVRVCKHRAAIV